MALRKLLLVLTVVGISQSLNAQTSEHHGRITDQSTGEVLIGASVMIKGQLNGTTSDTDGRFKILIDTGVPTVLVVSFIGYQTKEIQLTTDIQNIEVQLSPVNTSLNEVTVTARRRNEEPQNIPIPVAVLDAQQIQSANAYNVNRIKEFVPAVQLYSSNPRNTTLNIRGMGSTFGLTNDGIDPGVGFYVDGVYYARPAATTLDFIDVQQIEVLRGPQGTLFGRNTTSGAFNITSKKPTFSNSGIFEQSLGNYGFIQTKAFISGPLIKEKLAASFSFAGTQRDGNIYNQRTEKYTNTLNNLGVKSQVYFLPADYIAITLSGDYTRQRPDGYAQVIAGVVETQRSDFRQFDAIITDLNYTLPSTNPFDRVIDHDTPWRSNQDMGGISLNIDVDLAGGTLTSTTAWRVWTWDPSNDRDFTGLEALKLSQAPSIHHQFSQELRYAGEFNDKLSGVFGLFTFYQKLDADGAHTEESGKDQWRFVQTNEDPRWQTPGLLDGYGIHTKPGFRNFSGAVFAQLDWKVLEWFTVMPGLRLNYDQKEVDFSRKTYGGLQTTDPVLIAMQQSVYTDQEFVADIDDWKLSGQTALIFQLHRKARLYGTYALSFKPVGLNLGGLPTENGQPMIELAVVKPERVHHYEVGVKSEPSKNTTLNTTFFTTDIFDYQTNVRSAELGVNRGYLANAEHVRVKGAEVEVTYLFPAFLKVNLSVSITDGRYVSFTNAPVPLEETGGENFKDISGEELPGISKYATSGGIEIFKHGKFADHSGEFFIGLDTYYRSSFSSSPSASRYLNIDGYTLLNARLGFRATKGLSFNIWGRNLTDTDYFEQLLPAGGNTGQYAGVLGDPITYGVTMRYTY